MVGETREDRNKVDKTIQYKTAISVIVIFVYVIPTFTTHYVAILQPCKHLQLGYPTLR